MLPANGDADLPIDEAEVAAQLAEKFLEVIEQRGLQLGLVERGRLRQAEEFEHDRVAEDGAGGLQQATLA